MTFSKEKLNLSLALVMFLGIVGIAFACPYTPSNQYGGTGGGAFSDDLTETTKLTKINIWSGAMIDAIQATWMKPGGAVFTGTKHGGNGGGLSTINLKNDEYITRIDGRADGHVNQLTFTTNLGNKYGPYGGSGGKEFTLSGLNVGGFLGRSGAFIDALAVFSSK